MIGEGVEPSRPQRTQVPKTCATAIPPADRPCEWGESNSHGVSPTSPSSWRDYHSTTFALSLHRNLNPTLLLTEQAHRHQCFGGIVPGGSRTRNFRLRRPGPVPLWTGTSSWRRDLNSQPSAYRAVALPLSYARKLRLRRESNSPHSVDSRAASSRGTRKQKKVVGAERIELPSEACRTSALPLDDAPFVGTAGSAPATSSLSSCRSPE